MNSIGTGVFILPILIVDDCSLTIRDVRSGRVVCWYGG